MITFTVNDEIKVNLPTSIKDIDVKFLSDLSNEVSVAENYVLIGLIQGLPIRELPFLRQKSKKGFATTVLPVFIKAGKTDNELIKSCDVKDKLIISKTNIEIAEHIRLANNILTLDTLTKYIEIDDALRHSIVNIEFFKNNNISKDTMCYAIEFKLVPVSDIHGKYCSIEMNNPFVNTINK